MSEDRGDSGEGLVVVHLLIPMNDREGKLYPKNLKRRVEAELARRFGGWTQLSAMPLPGAWRNPETGEIELDSSVRYEVGIPAGRVGELDRLLADLAWELGQRAIWRVIFVGAEGRAIRARTSEGQREE